MCITRFVYLELLTQVSLKGNIDSKDVISGSRYRLWYPSKERLRLKAQPLTTIKH
jgi:hypothetical protein